MKEPLYELKSNFLKINKLHQMSIYGFEIMVHSPHTLPKIDQKSFILTTENAADDFHHLIKGGEESEIIIMFLN